MTGLFIVLFAFAVIAAGAFYVQYDSLRKKDAARRAEAESAAAAAQKAGKEAEAAKDELQKKKAEAAELREKLNELRAKTHKQRESDRKQKSSAASDLQDALDRARAELEEERARMDVLGREAKGMQEELGRLKESSKKLDEAYKTAQAALARAQSESAPAQSSAPAAPVVAAPRGDDELKARAEALESQARELRRKLALADDEAKKAKGAASTAKRQFLVTKSELDLFREKLVWSEKRVVELEKLAFDHKLALPEREASPQPKAPQLAPGMLSREGANTGGEGVVAGEADYVPEAETPAESAPAEPAAETLAATGSSEPAAEAGPQAVPPRRRAKPAESEAKAE